VGASATEGGGWEATTAAGSVRGGALAPGVDAPAQGGIARPTRSAQSLPPAAALPPLGSVAADTDSAGPQKEATGPAAAGTVGEKNSAVALLVSADTASAATLARTTSTLPVPPLLPPPPVAGGSKSASAAIAGRPTAVLLKRGMHTGTLNEFISAAEYIVNFGNPNVILCPRGTQPGLDGYRNHPDESITPLLKERTWAPVVIDPSHSVGKAVYVPACALAAVAYGADGLCIEAHVSPSHGLGDDPKQAVTPAVLAGLITRAKALHALRRSAAVS